MKVTATTLAPLALVAAPFVSADDGVKKACNQKAPEVVAAVEKYCNKLGTNALIPSPTAHEGAIGKDGDMTATVVIMGDCDPKQWVSQEFCRKQFYQLCASGNARGENKRRYGNKNGAGLGCQQWMIAKGNALDDGKGKKNGGGQGQGQNAQGGNGQQGKKENGQGNGQNKKAKKQRQGQDANDDANN